MDRSVLADQLGLALVLCGHKMSFGGPTGSEEREREREREKSVLLI